MTEVPQVNQWTRDKISPGRKDTVLLASLGANNPRSLGSGGGEGLLARTGSKFFLDHPSNRPPPEHKAIEAEI